MSHFPEFLSLSGLDIICYEKKQTHQHSYTLRYIPISLYECVYVELSGVCNAFSTSNSYISSAQCQCESLKSTHSNFTGAFSTSATVFFYCVTLGMWRVAVGNKSLSTTHCKLQNYISNKDKVKVFGRLYLCARLFVLIRVQIESEWK